MFPILYVQNMVFESKDCVNILCVLGYEIILAS